MKKNIYISGLYLIASAVLVIISYFTLFEQLIIIKLNGNEVIKVEVNEKYKELGATVYGTKKNYSIDGKVDTSKLATYTLTYYVETLITRTVERRVIVTDTTKPTITLDSKELTIYTYEPYQETTFTAIDNYDGDLTNKVTITNNVNPNLPGEYKVIYEVTDSNGNKGKATRKVIVKDKNTFTSQLTYINGILLVNKKYALPSTYNPGVNPEAAIALKKLQDSASANGHNIPLLSGFRSYSRQRTIYNNYVQVDGQALADTYSARPGHSEHQTGLAFDVGEISDYYGNTPAGIWLANNAHKFGFIIRYPQGKTHITGYKYEPWHIRYIGIEHATNIYNQNTTLEEYLNAQ